MITIEGLCLFTKAGQVDAASDVVSDPVCVPPLFGIDLDSIELHREMDVVTARHPSHATDSHTLRAFNNVAYVHVDATVMAVDGLQAVAMADHDAVAVNVPRGAAQMARQSFEASTPTCFVTVRS